MRTAIRRLSLGIGLIILVSGILLVSDWNRGNTAKHKIPRVAVFQFSSRPLLDEGVAGVIEGLKARGFIQGQTIRIEEFNSQNDLPTANSIARAIEDGGYDLAITVSTPCLQAMASANRAGKVTHVFGLVTDPFIAGVGLNRDRPLEHPRYMVGIGTFQPVRDALLYAKRSYPALRRVGTVWNPAEACSEACMRVARSTCKEMGVELLEAQVESSTAVGEATSSLLARGVEAIFIGGDNTVEMAMNTIVKLANEGRIPVIGCAPGHADVGALIGLGADYVEVGRAEGRVGGGPALRPRPCHRAHRQSHAQQTRPESLGAPPIAGEVGDPSRYSGVRSYRHRREGTADGEGSHTACRPPTRSRSAQEVANPLGRTGECTQPSTRPSKVFARASKRLAWWRGGTTN